MRNCLSIMSLDEEHKSSCGPDNRLQEKEISGTDVNRAFIVFNFSDDNLNADLRRAVLNDKRLRKLLESGIPSWAIFFQSYPLLFRCYRSWMRRLVRAIHGLILLGSFMIAFYDLYRNVPIIKADIFRVSSFIFRRAEQCKLNLFMNLQRATSFLMKMGILLAKQRVKAGFGNFIAPICAAVHTIFGFIGIFIYFLTGKIGKIYGACYFFIMYAS